MKIGTRAGRARAADGIFPTAINSSGGSETLAADDVRAVDLIDAEARIRRDAVVFTGTHEAPALDDLRARRSPARRLLLRSTGASVERDGSGELGLVRARAGRSLSGRSHSYRAES
jgi:hypothetical protein